MMMPLPQSYFALELLVSQIFKKRKSGHCQEKGDHFVPYATSVHCYDQKINLDVKNLFNHPVSYAIEDLI
jgi:hypothetical protein